MTNKRKRFYEIALIVCCLIIIGLTAYMGITAVQKSMKLNMSFQMNPSIYVKVEIYNTSTSKYETIFQNTNATEIKSGVILSGNTLQFANDYATTLGTSLKMKVTSLNEGITMLTEFSGASVTSGGNTITATATTYNVASDELTVNTLSNLTIQFSQVFTVDVNGVNTASTTITAGQNVYTINGTYYVKSTATNAQFTLTSKEHYQNPPASITVDGATYEYTTTSEEGTLTLTKINGDVSITASADPSSYTITYNTDGGSAISAQNYTYKADITLAAAPTKANYDFTGWKVGATVGSWTSGTTYTAGQTITDDMHGNVTLVAQWKVKVYTLTYNANPVSTYADNGITPPTQGSMETSEYQHGESKALTTNDFTMLKGTYNSAGTFRGWSEDPNATKATYTDEQSITISQDTTLYAVWDYVWTIKAYNQTNVTTGYNSNFDGYYYVEMGEYPQTYKSDDTIQVYSTEAKTTNITTSITISGTIGYGSDGYRYYWQNAMKYQYKLKATHTFDKAYGVNGWYKIEPLRWIIIGGGKSETTTYGTGSNKNSDSLGSNELLLLSEYVLYAVPFDGSHYQGDDYSCQNRYYTSGNMHTTSDVWCSINGWTGSRGDSDPNTNNGVDYINQADALHVRENSFINLSGLKDIMTANSSLIVSKTLSTTYKGGTDSSPHKIFLLGGYGDSFSRYNYLGGSGKPKATGYATGFAHATSAYGSGSGNASRPSNWWLRSGDSDRPNGVSYVGRDGSVYGSNVHEGDSGVRPCFCLNLA